MAAVSMVPDVFHASLDDFPDAKKYFQTLKPEHITNTSISKRWAKNRAELVLLRAARAENTKLIIRARVRLFKIVQDEGELQERERSLADRQARKREIYERQKAERAQHKIELAQEEFQLQYGGGPAGLLHAPVCYVVFIPYVVFILYVV